MKAKILILGLICLCLFSCKNTFENPYSAAIPSADKIEEGAKTQIRFTLKVEHCGKYPPELEEIAWYEIFEIYINDGVDTYGDGLLLHTHEFGRGGGCYYELPEIDYSFIPALDFPGTRTYCPGAFQRTTKFDFEVWFYLKESNIPSELMHLLNPRFIIDLEPLEDGFDFGGDSRLDSRCVEWVVGERTISSPDCTYNILMFRVMIIDD